MGCSHRFKTAIPVRMPDKELVCMLVRDFGAPFEFLQYILLKLDSGARKSEDDVVWGNSTIEAASIIEIDYFVNGVWDIPFR
jgi:hypothetical protein